MKKLILLFISILIYFGFNSFTFADNNISYQPLISEYYHKYMSVSNMFNTSTDFNGYVSYIYCENENYGSGYNFLRLGVYIGSSLHSYHTIQNLGNYTFPINSFATGSYRITTTQVGSGILNAYGSFSALKCSINGFVNPDITNFDTFSQKYNSYFINPVSASSSLYLDNPNLSNTGSYLNLFFQDNYGNYRFSKNYHDWQDITFYGVIIVIIGVYLFFKFMRFLIDLFFKP